MPGFVFFDTETTGLRPGWDQIVHFAAIRTDHELKEIDRFEVRSRLQPHVIPHPKALLTNGISIARLCDPELPSHYQMTCAILHKLAEWSAAIFVGYNSIRFDEEMLRHSLFQALHDPYITSRPGNGRADALTLALSAFAMSPNCLKAPLDADGRPRFKLPGIAAANGLLHDKAHDALSDVEVTIELCRLIRDQADELWQRFQRFANKAGVAQFVEAEDGFILSEFFGGTAFHRPVAVIGLPPGNPNGRLCLDLSVDPDFYEALSDDDLAASLCRKGSPVRRLAINAGPALTELWAAPHEFLNGVSLEDAEDRARRLKDNTSLCARLVATYTQGWTDRASSPHPEERLYSGDFPSFADRDRRSAFHEASRSERLEIVAAFEDERLKAFGRRLIHNEHRGALSGEERRTADIELANRLLDEAGGPLTLPGAIAALDELIAQGADDAAQLLPAYRDWLNKRIERAETFRRVN